jgi:hypothetical protein
MTEDMQVVARHAFKNCMVLTALVARFLVGGSAVNDFSKEVMAPGSVRPGFESYPLMFLLTRDGFPSGFPAPISSQMNVHFPAAMKAIGYTGFTPYSGCMARMCGMLCGCLGKGGGRVYVHG